MANPKHLAIIKRGVEAWNDWRSAHLRAKPDLRGADLSGRRELYHHANLSRTDLRGANFLRSYFSEAFLHDADFTGANLEQADFNNIYGADICFRGANLRNAFLNDGILDWSDLRGADTTGAVLYRPSFREADLRGVALMEQISARFPTTYRFTRRYSCRMRRSRHCRLGPETRARHAIRPYHHEPQGTDD